MIDFKKPSRRMQIQLEPILSFTFIAQRYRDIAYGRVRTAVAEVDDSAKALPRKDQVLPAKVAMDGKAWQRAVLRAAKLLQNADAFLHMRPEEPMWLVLNVATLSCRRRRVCKSHGCSRATGFAFLRRKEKHRAALCALARACAICGIMVFRRGRELEPSI